MKSINVKEARLLEQWLHSNIASTTFEELISFLNDKEVVVAKAMDELYKSELYQKVGGDIQAKAEEIVKEKCEPEWNRISEEMKPIGEKRNELAKEKASNNWDNLKEDELAELDKKMSDLSAEYQKVTDEANAELNEYKEKRINEEQGGCFFLEDDEYEIVGKYAGWILPTKEE